MTISPVAGRDYPAHLHINLAPAYRSRGIGGELIEAFIADAARAGARGAHVVTSAEARNVRFYERVGFAPRAYTMSNGSRLVLLGRRIPHA
ncbi:MAG: GNAT family N-acetyltransferase [Hyphomicrobium sp.]